MENIIETQSSKTIITRTITRQQVQDLYSIFASTETQDKHPYIKSVLYSLLQYPDQEYQIIVNKYGHHNPTYSLCINEIYQQENITQEESIAWHSLLQWSTIAKLIRKYKPKNKSLATNIQPCLESSVTQNLNR